MTISNNKLIFPIKRLIEPTGIQNTDGTGGKTSTTNTNNIVQSPDKITDDFGGVGLELIYDASGDLIQVLGDGVDVRLFTKEETGNLDHIEERFPGRSPEIEGFSRTTLDYVSDADPTLTYVYTEDIK